MPVRTGERVDWVFGTGSDKAVDDAYSAVVDHLRRHAADAAVVDRAAETLRTRLAETVARAGGRGLHARLRWSATEAQVDLAALEVPYAEASCHARDDGTVPVRHRKAVRALPREDLDTLSLPVSPAPLRLFEAGPPPAVPPVEGDLPSGPTGALLALVGAADAFPASGGPELSLVAGAALAESAPVPQDAAAAGATYRSLYAALGGEAEVVGRDRDRLEIAVRACPFAGEQARGDSFSLCYLSVGLAGQLAARVAGSARVLLDESIARGDHECRLEVLLDDVDDPRAQPFHSPQRTTAPQSAVPHLELSVSLPRESVSVPVVRRLAAQALRSFGVDPDDVDDVQVAISEACGNVIDHADASDVYDVRVDLAADRCAITVIDQGGGFDAGSVPVAAEKAAESGRGLQLMRVLVDSVSFINEPQAGAVVHMVKELHYDHAHPLQRVRREG